MQIISVINENPILFQKLISSNVIDKKNVGTFFIFNGSDFSDDITSYLGDNFLQ